MSVQCRGCGDCRGYRGRVVVLSLPLSRCQGEGGAHSVQCHVIFYHGCAVLCCAVPCRGFTQPLCISVNACVCRARMEAIEDEIHLNREKSRAEAALFHKVTNKAS